MRPWLCATRRVLAPMSVLARAREPVRVLVLVLVLVSVLVAVRVLDQTHQ